MSDLSRPPQPASSASSPAGVSLLRREDRLAPPGQPLVRVTPADVGWRYVGFAAYRLSAGRRLDAATGENETALVVLGGTCAVRGAAWAFERVGRRTDVWEMVPPFVVLVPPGETFTVQASTPVHLAIASAPATHALSPRLITPGEISVEVRGEGRTRRTIHHLLPPSAPAARLILVEVYTPAGNWSSFPPHKHDVEDPPHEACLEETYYYQIRPSRGFALQRIYSDDRSLDETVAPEDGALVLVPRGYHPVAATPGHDCYYLNVMAGPGRAWNFRVDPDYAALMNWQKPPVAEVGT